MLPIHHFAVSGDVEGISRELSLGVSVDVPDLDEGSTQGFTPLMLAAGSNESNQETLHLLLERGANLHIQAGEFEQTVLSTAVSVGDPVRVRFLLDAGADIHYMRPSSYDVLIDALHGRPVEKDESLVPLFELLIERGAELNTISDYGESALSVASRIGRFDIITLLLQVEVLSWLIEQGADLDAKDEFGGTALIMAAQEGATECVRRLLQAGASINSITTPEEKSQKGPDLRASLEALAPDIEALTGEAAPDLSGIDFDRYDYEDEKTIHRAANLDIVRLLVEAGEDIGDISDEMRAQLTGLESEGKVECTREDYLVAKHRRFGTSNPERMNIAFWRAMVRSGATAYAARATFDDTGNYQDEAVWCFHRFGKSLTELPDGRIIEIGGEHEDSYDPDFCIYNEVFVHHGGGDFEILGYPEETLPPTDFHSATLVGEFIYIIGCLGYPEARVSGETPVYRLHCDTLAIEKLETSGDKPGWISRHKAVFQPDDISNGEIRVWGGKVWEVVEDEIAYFDNSHTYVLDLKTLDWRQTLTDVKA